MELKQLKKFEDACKVEGLNPKKALPKMTGVQIKAKDAKALIAIAKLTIIARAANKLVNGGKPWRPNWNDYNEYKYYAWFDGRGPSGFRFSDYDSWRSGSYVGSRLAFKTSEAATHVGKQFEKLFKDFMDLN